MPEGLEAELYRRAAERTVGRRIAAVTVDERQPAASELADAIPGAVVTGARRHGKLVLLDLDDSVASVLGLHFGMTGRLVVDDEAPIDRLEYASRRDDPAWDRLVIGFDDGGTLRVNDPRRWARFDVDPDLDRLGPDFLTVGADELIERLGRRRIAVKAALLDQSLVAGYGNLCVDEVLWQIGLDPTVPAQEVAPAAVARLVEIGRRHLLQMLERGGSHTGTIDPAVRSLVPACPKDGGPMQRSEVGGRTTVWCPTHQTDGLEVSPSASAAVAD